jgi:outer membrane receptor protein involved in Fe transport
MRSAYPGASAAAGSYETYRGSAWVDGSWKDLTYSLSARYLTADGYRDNSATEGIDVGLNLSWYPLDYARIYLGGWYHNDDTGLPGAIRESDFAAGAQRDGTLFPDDFSEIDEQVVKGGVELSFAGDSLFTLDLSHRRRDLLSYASFVGGNYTGDTGIDTVNVSPQLLIRRALAGLPNVLTVGLDYRSDEEEITNESLYFGEETSGVFVLEKENYGLYLRDEVSVGEALSLSAGYRYDRADFSFGPGNHEAVDMDENLGTAGINYAFPEGSFAYVSYSKSFRYPVLDELFNFFSSTINADLTSQRTDDFETGFRCAFGGRTYAHLNLFHSSTDDEIFFNPLSYANENLDGKAVRRGAEITFEALPAEWLALNGSYTYVRTKIDGGVYDGSRVPNVPTNKASLSAVFTPAKGLALTLEGIYVGERPFISDFGNLLDAQEDYAVVNGKIEYRWKKIAVSLAANNLADREYTEYGALGGFPVERAYFPSPGRNFTAGLTARF